MLLVHMQVLHVIDRLFMNRCRCRILARVSVSSFPSEWLCPTGWESQVPSNIHARLITPSCPQFSCCFIGASSPATVDSIWCWRGTRGQIRSFKIWNSIIILLIVAIIFAMLTTLMNHIIYGVHSYRNRMTFKRAHVGRPGHLVWQFEVLCETPCDDLVWFLLCFIVGWGHMKLQG